MSKADLCVNIVERNFSMNRSVTTGILKGIKEYMVFKKKDIVVSEWRPLCKYINRQGAIVLLDMMSSEDVAKMVFAYLVNNEDTI